MGNLTLGRTAKGVLILCTSSGTVGEAHKACLSVPRHSIMVIHLRGINPPNLIFAYAENLNDFENGAHAILVNLCESTCIERHSLIYHATQEKSALFESKYLTVNTILREQ